MTENFNKIIDQDLAYITKANLPWEKLEGKNILIAGATGVLPAYMLETVLYLNENLFKQKANVFALARNPEKANKRFARYAKNKNLKFIIQDVCDKIKIDENLNYIIHAASLASPKYYGLDPIGTILPNVLGTYNLLELASEKKIENFLFFSSGAIYGQIQKNEGLTNEHDLGLIDPLTIEACYPESKKMGENMCFAWFKQYGVPIKIIRPFHIYGPGISLSDGRVFADFVGNILRNENIIMASDGSAKRPFCYLADATLGFFTVLLKGVAGEAYNVAGGREISIKELAEILIGLYPEKNLKIIFKENTDKGYIKTSVSKYSPDISKIKNLGWKPEYSLEEGFKRMINSYE